MMAIRHKKQILLIALVSFIQSEKCAAQSSEPITADTLKVTLQDAEQLFVQKNLLLLAARFNVDAQRALILQAKLYPNPYFSYTNAVYNTNNKKYFDLSNQSDHTPTLSQLILLGGKRKKQAGIAETNTKLAEDAYLDLLRTLKFTLRSDFFSIYYLQRSEKIYVEEVAALKTILTAFQAQLEKGYVSKSEVVRIQAQLYALQSEYADLKNQINDQESELRTVLALVGTYIVPLVDSGKIESDDPAKFTITTLLDSASVNRPDLMMAQHRLELSNQNLRYQKSLVVPDITVGSQFVQRSNFINNELAYAFGLSVPLFNQNQGNIKSAKFQIKSSEANLKGLQLQYQENVFRARQRAITQHDLFLSLDKNFSNDFDELAKTVLENYRKRNMGLLEFLNFYDSYKQNSVQLNSILMDLANSYENINYMTGTNFFNQ